MIAEDPPDKLAILIVCQTQEEAQHVPPAQHNMKAGDLPEAQRVHPVLDAGVKALAAEEAHHVRPVQRALEAGDLAAAQHVPPAQHELEAGDLAEVQLVHCVLDTVDPALAATKVQHVPPNQQVLVAEDNDLAAIKVQHVPPNQQVLVAEDSVLETNKAQCVKTSQPVLITEDRALAPQDLCNKIIQQVMLAGQLQATAQDCDQQEDHIHQYADSQVACRSPVHAQSHSIPIPGQSHSTPVPSKSHRTPVPAQLRVQDPDYHEVQADPDGVETLDVDSQSDEPDGGPIVLLSTAASHSNDRGHRMWKSINEIILSIGRFGHTWQVRAGMRMAVMTLMVMLLLMLMVNLTGLKQITWTIDTGHTGGLDNILRFDISNIAGDIMDNPKTEIYDRVPVSDNIGFVVTKDSDALKDTKKSREDLPTTSSCGGLVGEVVAGTANSAPSPSSSPRGPGGKAGNRQPRGECNPESDQLIQVQDNTEGDENQVLVCGPQQSLATGQEYMGSRQRFKTFKVMEYTGQQIQMHENTKPAGQNIMGYVKPHQLDGQQDHLGADRGHLQRDGYWDKQQADHAFHQGDPLRDTKGHQELPGGQDHQAEPHGRAQVQGELVEKQAHHDDLLWDSEVDDATKDDVIGHQEGVVEHDQPDDQTKDTGGGIEPHDIVDVIGV